MVKFVLYVPEDFLIVLIPDSAIEKYNYGTIKKINSFAKASR